VSRCRRRIWLFLHMSLVPQSRPPRRRSRSAVLAGVAGVAGAVAAGLLRRPQPCTGCWCTGPNGQLCRVPVPPLQTTGRRVAEVAGEAWRRRRLPSQLPEQAGHGSCCRRTRSSDPDRGPVAAHAAGALLAAATLEIAVTHGRRPPSTPASFPAPPVAPPLPPRSPPVPTPPATRRHSTHPCPGLPPLAPRAPAPTLARRFAARPTLVARPAAPSWPLAPSLGCVQPASASKRTPTRPMRMIQAHYGVSTIRVKSNGELQSPQP
jgi:hypothetical protein